MKKIFSIVLAFAAALFAGVACTPEEPVVPPTFAVTPLEEPLPCTEGIGTLEYIVENPIAGSEIVFGESTAEWLGGFAVVEGENKIQFEYAANNDAPSSEPREASFTVAYGALEPVTVTIRQYPQPYPFSVEITKITPMGCNATITPLDLEAKYFYIATTDKLINDAAAKAGTTGYEAFTTGAEVLMYETVSNWMPYNWNSKPKSGVVEATEDDYTAPLQWNELAEGINPRIIICGIAQDENENVILTTFAQVVELELTAYPVINVPEEQRTQNIGAEAGEILLDLVLENPIEGCNVGVSTKASWLKPNADANGTAIIEDGKLRIAYEANPYGSVRTATITLNYDYASRVDINVVQAANANAEPITITITIKERHWDYILVDVTPSDESVTCCIGALSKKYYDGGNYNYDGTDAGLVKATLTSYGTQRFEGKQTNYKITKFTPSLNASSEGEEYYVWAYAADGGYGEATGAISDVTKVLTTVVYDKPAINILSVTQTVEGETTTLEAKSGKYYVSPKPATITFTYEVTNPTTNGEVRWNGSYYLSNYYNVINSGTEVLDTEKKQVTFQTNAYDAEQYSHNASIYIAYFADGASDTSSDATASISIVQNAE